jgi:imidazolonepropionase
VAWAGRDADVGSAVELEPGAEVIDAAGGVVMPGLVDPHTHLIFAGSRHQEFALRLAGKGYLDILAAGGGILSTVRATRAAPLAELVEGGRRRLARLLSFGVTTCEVKSGYGLELATELKMLEAARALARTQPVRLVPTFLGAHVVPEEHRARPEGYVDLLCREMIPEVASRGLAEMCDVFLDQGAFSRDQARRVLETAKAAGLRPRLHAGQFTDQGGPELAAELGATSADHLEHVSDAGAAAMAAAGVVACLLPGAALSLGMRFPDAARLRAAGVEVALATDCNPGTSMTENLPLMVTLGATAMKLEIEDALRGVTCVAARALGLERALGAVVPGLRADLVQFDVPDYRCLAYHFGVTHARRVIAGGRVVLGD